MHLAEMESTAYWLSTRKTTVCHCCSVLGAADDCGWRGRLDPVGRVDLSAGDDHGIDLDEVDSAVGAEVKTALRYGASAQRPVRSLVGRYRVTATCMAGSGSLQTDARRCLMPCVVCPRRTRIQMDAGSVGEPKVCWSGEEQVR